MVENTSLNRFQIPLKLLLAYTMISSETDGVFNLLPILTVLGLSGLVSELSHSQGKKKEN